MYIPLGIKSDYSLLKSLIKLPDLIKYLKLHNVTTCGLLDDNLFGSMCFYNLCVSSDIKPIIGLKVKVGINYIYLYAKNYDGYQNLLKINTLIQKQEINLNDLVVYKNNLICVVPYKYHEVFDEVNKMFDDVYIAYNNDYEKKNAFIISTKLVYLNEIVAITATDVKYVNYLREIESGEKSSFYNENKDSYLEKEVNDKDSSTTIEFASKIDLVIPKDGRYIPHYDNSIEDSYSYLALLCKKGLAKRLNNEVSDVYNKRLIMELDVINKMGFVDYFLIVYDYVKYAKSNGILVGPGRGSAAGSLVSYCLGITNVDPIKYDLLFERFLNPERITMPDIDIDFEDIKRDQVIDYVKNRYGISRVANIMTFGTLGARQVVRDVGKCLNTDSKLIDRLCNLIDPRSNLKDNLNNKVLKELLDINVDLQKVYKVAFKLEGLKRHISTHAAGVVISSVDLDDVIPVCISNGDVLTGVTMEYLEDLGLLKMDFLALRNLTIIDNVLALIERETGKKINLYNIPLDDKDTLNIFKSVDTVGIFQFESSGMKNFLSKLKADSFDDIVAALALFRPGPMQNIDLYISRKEGKEDVVYPDSSLEDILSSTYGIMIYQEQIMQVLSSMANYSFAEADNIRRAMSKKKHDVMEREREVFVTRSISNGFTKEKAEEIYDLILKFADYGFNKAHSVSYALIGYQMAYLKSKYPVYFMANLLNMCIDSDIKTKDYIDEAKRKNILVFKPNINVSSDTYKIKDNALLLPLNSIHNIGISTVTDIINERKENGKFTDFFNFMCRMYGKNINKKIVEALIDADCFRDFNINHKTLAANIDSALDYAMLCSDLDESLVMKPNLVIEDEYLDAEIMSRELATFGFYVTNHPSSKYQDGIMKLKDIRKYFDKYVELVVIISSVRKIKTKKGEDMGFISASDETDTGDFIIFPKYSSYLYAFKKDDFVKIKGQVNRRNDKFSIVVSNIEML
ncbi:MAG: DNA polymerase III subunit alpha [Bacilli bacterium]|nr:DNA polymerase III subunit alpha [Bacilli bacterium]